VRKVTSPTILDLADHEYVIPTEDATAAARSACSPT
jgi:hypothetical protein